MHRQLPLVALALPVAIAQAPRIEAQVVYLKAPVSVESGLYGEGASADGARLVVGMPQADDGAFVYVRSGSSWALEDTLDPPSSVLLGVSTALEGDTAVVGAPGGGVFSSGEAFVYRRSGSSWSLEDILSPPAPAFVGTAGTDVALSGNTIVLGAPGEAGAAGQAHVYVRSGSTWSFQATLAASNADPGDFFGQSVAISGNTIVVGAPFEASDADGIGGTQGSNTAPNAGAAYVFTRSGTSWSQQAYLKASVSDAMDMFGWATTIDGETIVVGAHFEQSTATGVNGDDTNNGFPGAGAAYVFTRTGSTWSQQAYLKASNTGFADQFGFALALRGDTLLVGAPTEESNATGINGDENDNSVPQTGAAYVFDRVGTTWSQRSYLKATNPDPQDTFGLYLALSEGFAIVGAPGEDSAASGINGNDADNSLEDSGAAYTYPVDTLAANASRNAGTNPASLASGPAILGQTLSVTIDLAGTTGHTSAVLIGFSTPLSLTLGSGQTLLVNVADPNGEQLGLAPQSGATVTYDLPVPNGAPFLGFPVSLQAVHFGGVVPFALSNAADLTVGY